MQMSFMREVYAVSSEYLGLSEISGPKDNRMIEVAHRLCGIEGGSGGTYTDEIPWCSAWIVLCMVMANIRRNPFESKLVLISRKIPESIIKEIFQFAKVPWASSDVATKLPFIHPTWSASSLSWDSWGVEVPNGQAQRGDLLRLTRDGGGHITQMDEDKLGLVMLRCLGGNQSNKVTSSTSYLRSRLVHIRGAKEDIDLPIPSVPQSSTPLANPTLKRGSKGQWVALLQKHLSAMSFPLAVDGDFGPQTELIVKKYQKFVNLNPDGVVGPKTWGSILGSPVLGNGLPSSKVTTGTDPDEGTLPWYRRMFAACEVDLGKQNQVNEAVSLVEKGFDRYLSVARRLDCAVPEHFAHVLGVIHFKEASCNFNGVLHNGEKILGTGRKTFLVPKGRGPFNTWEEAAIDAINMKYTLFKDLINGDLDIGGVLSDLERYNGTGYISGAGREETSPYLWACSNINDDRGKYTSDGKFNPNASTQESVGAAVILKELYLRNKFAIKN
jgi:lysozyme family protein